jgi:hypothetical protein
MPADRFRFLEGAKEPLPDDLKRALGRFASLEIAGTPAPVASPRKPCPGCGAGNADGAAECAACRRLLEPEPQVIPSDGELVLILDGQTYRSSDKDLPDDIATLMRQIRRKGYSKKLLTDWRSWRVTRRSRKEPAAQTAKPLPVLRVNGRLLLGSDISLPEEMRVLLGFIATRGVTPALITHLKELGHDVSYDPQAEGGAGLLDVRVSEGLTGLLKRRTVRFVVIAAVAWLLLRPLRQALPEYLQPVTSLLPLGFALAWALR